LKPAAEAEFARRDASRMDAAQAARAGFEGFKAGHAVVIPGWSNRLTAQAYRLLPRALMRRIVRRAMTKRFD
jgi:short-subunit dehydrogenase